MKRIGKTDGGGVIIEMDPMDVVRVMEACKALSVLMDEVDVCLPPREVETAPAMDEPRPAPAAKPTRKTVKAAAPKLAKFPPRKCEVCGVEFVPTRKDSHTCSRTCLKAYHNAKKNGKKAAPKPAAGKPVPVVAAPPPAPPPVANKADRLALIKRLASKGVRAPVPVIERSGVAPRLDDIPEFQRAQAAARED